ncbi:MAG: nickel pincer cofactor biosynthesis protein LarB [candidate division Zixibacteria bacterium]|nr:nickel pincer cofactor biosynthesis protein LarB [candidate division Zixibacteria bacterium]
MDKNSLRWLLESLSEGKVDVDQALERLKGLPYDDIGFAKLDTHRDLRRGFPEVVFCMGKTAAQVSEIMTALGRGERLVMATKATADLYAAVKERCPEAVYHEAAQIILSGPMPEPRTEKNIAVVSAGTSDMPIAEEAAVTAESMGNPVERLYDIGVAGIHRLLHNKEKLFAANVIIVVAGMEGALASVVGGMVSSPVIAVPTSIGYGASFNGLAPLLSMLNCCAPGVVVVNIDNGFGAGYSAAVINQMDTER